MTKKKDWEIDRRTFLKGSFAGAGILLGLPLLDIMMPSLARAQASGIGKKLFIYHHPDGVNLNGYFPNSPGALPTNLPYQLSPLQSYKDKLLLMKVSYNTNWHDDVHSESIHKQASRKGLRCTGKVDLSLDQEICQALQQSGVKSLHFVGEKSGGDLPWSIQHSLGPQGEITATDSLTELYNSIIGSFGGGAGGASTGAKILNMRKSVLDFVADQRADLLAKVGREDKIRLNQYFDQIRSIEQGILSENSRSCAAPESPSSIARTSNKKIDLAINIMAMAFQCDITTAGVIQHVSGLSNYKPIDAGDFSQVPGLNALSQSDLDNCRWESDHGLQHTDDSRPEARRVLMAMDYWGNDIIRRMADKVSSLQDPEGKSLLDNCLILGVNCMSDGNAHSYDGIPLRIISNKMNAGNLYRDYTNTNYRVADVYAGILNQFVPSKTSYANSTQMINLKNPA